MNWSTANAWAVVLDPYGSGITGWRLPDTNPVNGVSYNYSFAYDGSTDRGFNNSAPGTAHAGSTGSEMAHLFYKTLGNLAYYDTSGSGPQAGWGLTNTGRFPTSSPATIGRPRSTRLFPASRGTSISTLATRTTKLRPLTTTPGLFTRAMSAHLRSRCPPPHGCSPAACWGWPG
jgi:hypothetical protein